MLTTIISNWQEIKPVMWMIEANIYTNESLSVNSVKSFDNSLEIHSYDDITYIINVIAK